MHISTDVQMSTDVFLLKEAKAQTDFQLLTNVNIFTDRYSIVKI